ncbi:unnamed protein product [Symbiodinium natans]|uniref:Uncharacterized protein n=1 Tax=Symbiodinium natans TaxID=878477 RepID=A0A812QI01_9DINO|nr:unnamed protein product [Symbiodinium natans]
MGLEMLGLFGIFWLGFSVHPPYDEELDDEALKSGLVAALAPGMAPTTLPIPAFVRPKPKVVPARFHVPVAVPARAPPAQASAAAAPPAPPAPPAQVPAAAPPAAVPPAAQPLLFKILTLF